MKKDHHLGTDSLAYPLQQRGEDAELNGGGHQYSFCRMRAHVVQQCDGQVGQAVGWCTGEVQNTAQHSTGKHGLVCGVVHCKGQQNWHGFDEAVLVGGWDDAESWLMTLRTAPSPSHHPHDS